MPNPSIPKLVVPIRFVNGKALVCEQDSQQEIEQCVEASLRTREGERVERPGFGIPDFAHQMGGVPVDVLREHIEEDEPRARFLVESDSEIAAMVARVSVEMEGVQNG